MSDEVEWGQHVADHATGADVCARGYSATLMDDGTVAALTGGDQHYEATHLNVPEDHLQAMIDLLQGGSVHGVLEPVADWYGRDGDEDHPPRPLADVVNDVVHDLVKDREAALLLNRIVITVDQMPGAQAHQIMPNIWPLIVAAHRLCKGAEDETQNLLDNKVRTMRRLQRIATMYHALQGADPQILDPHDELDWHSVAVGMCLVDGVSVNEARSAALRVTNRRPDQVAGDDPFVEGVHVPNTWVCHDCDFTHVTTVSMGVADNCVCPNCTSKDNPATMARLTWEQQAKDAMRMLGAQEYS